MTKQYKKIADSSDALMIKEGDEIVVAFITMFFEVMI